MPQALHIHHTFISVACKWSVNMSVFFMSVWVWVEQAPHEICQIFKERKPVQRWWCVVLYMWVLLYCNWKWNCNLFSVCRVNMKLCGYKSSLSRAWRFIKVLSQLASVINQHNQKLPSLLSLFISLHALYVSYNGNTTPFATSIKEKKLIFYLPLTQ